MDAIELLLQEHQSHRKLLELIISKNDSYLQFRDELVHHVEMEEAVFYPGLMKNPQLEPLIREAWEEHNLCMQLLQELDDESMAQNMWQPKFEVLKKLILTHIDDEEKALFPRIKELAPSELLESLAELMQIQKTLNPTDEILYPEDPGSHKLQS